MENNLATELLHEIKLQSKRWFIAFIVCLILLFSSNILWLYTRCLPVENESTVVGSNDTGNASFIHGEVDIINGEDNLY